MKLVLQIALGIILAPIVAIVLLGGVATAFVVLANNAGLLLGLGAITAAVLAWVKWAPARWQLFKPID